MIKVKGSQVALAELEAPLLSHPAVADSAVVGVTKYKLSFQRIATVTGRSIWERRAYIVPKVGKPISSQAIASFVEQRVSKTKRITGGVRFIDTIPKNPSGKVLHKVLREKASTEDSQGMPKL